MNSPASIVGPLTLGSRGQHVRTLQETLNRTTPSPGLQADGAFGIKTDAAVRAFQRSHNLKVDGIVGPRTAAALGLRYTAAAPVPQPPSLPRRPHESPIQPSGDSTAAAQLIEAFLQGLLEIQSTVLSTINNLEELPDVVLNEIRSHLSSPFQAAAATLRGAARLANANASAAAKAVEGAVRSSTQQVIAALQAVLSVLSRLPDILGISGVADKIRAIIVKLQRTVDGVIDTILRTLIGAGTAVGEAISIILGSLRTVAHV